MEITSCRIKDSTKQKIKFAQSVIKIDEEIKNNNKSIKYSEDQIINKSLDKLLDDIGVKMPKDIDIDPSTIQGMEGVLKRDRVDNNFKPKNKRILKNLGEALFDEGMVSKKLGYDEIITILIENYIEKFPKLKKYTLKDEYINQQFQLKEVNKKRNMYGNI